MQLKRLFPILTALLLSGLFALPALAAEPFETAGEAGQWIMNYYQNPEPERLSQALATLSASQEISEDGDKIIVSFLGTALARASADVRKQFFEDVSATNRTRLFALPCFWFMADDAGTAMLKRAEKEWTGPDEARLAEQLLGADRPALLEGEVKSALHLDHLWSMFFATGDAEPVLKIASAMAMEGDPAMQRHMVALSASWSLSANARIHPRVREILEQAAEVAEEPMKSKLLKTLQQVQ